MRPKTLLWLVVGLLLAIPAWAEVVGAPTYLTLPPADPDGGYSVAWTASPTVKAATPVEKVANIFGRDFNNRPFPV